MIYAIIILVCIILILLLYVIKLKKEIRYVKNEIDKNTGYVNLRTKSIDSELEELVESINKIYDSRQELEAKNKRMESETKRSIANMSHDLRTPLTSVMGYVQLLEDDNISNDEKKEYIQIIKRRNENLRELISSFFDLSRLNSNEYKFEFEKIDLKNILCDNIGLYYDEFMKKDIEPKIELEDGDFSVITDKSAMSRVFSNLISNMIKHGEGNVQISLRKENNIIIPEFKNKAASITDESIGKIFDRFYTVDKSRTSKSTGLGLYITKTFVEKLGYSIEAKYKDENIIITINIPCKA